MKKILNKYRELARYIDKDIKIKKGNDWCCYVEDKKIHIPKIESENGEKEFQKTIYNALPQNKKYLVKIINPVVWSFLHEVGHIEKGKRINDDLIRSIANGLGLLGLEKIAQFIYFNLKEERLATKWATQFAVQNEELVKRFSKEIEKTYYRYYKSMNIQLEEV